MKQSTIFKLTFKTVMFFGIFFELLYCYDISLENFFQSIFYTFFPQPRRQRHQSHPKRSKRLFGTPNPEGKATKATSIAFSWRSSLPFAPAIAFYWRSSLRFARTPFWHPQPRRQRQQGPINSFSLAFSFFLAFTPAVCQASNPPNAPNAFLAPPTPEAKAAGPHQ